MPADPSIVYVSPHQLPPVPSSMNHIAPHPSRVGLVEGDGMDPVISYVVPVKTRAGFGQRVSEVIESVVSFFTDGAKGLHPEFQPTYSSHPVINRMVPMAANNITNPVPWFTSGKFASTVQATTAATPAKEPEPTGNAYESAPGFPLPSISFPF